MVGAPRFERGMSGSKPDALGLFATRLYFMAEGRGVEPQRLPVVPLSRRSRTRYSLPSIIFGVERGNRTLVICLEGRGPAAERPPHIDTVQRPNFSALLMLFITLG